MTIQFSKYQGTGNDFVILDNRNGAYNALTNEQVKLLCDRKFGIGADGLMLLNEHAPYDFEMVYYNADGNEGSMCGNGGRCLVKFAYHSGIVEQEYRFIATDGEHEAEIDISGTVKLKMKDVDQISNQDEYSVLNTGSPHYVTFVPDVKKVNVVEEGRRIRYSKPFSKEGINVNFVENIDDDTIFVRTYERGVENETLSCGTGVTAAALVAAHNTNGFNGVNVQTPGGNLSVEFTISEDGEKFSDIWLSGPAELVYKGEITLN
ncbi:MAG: diaminopimelate epimerase [Chitinophagaceae bacterium]|nr:diaminopimelate epimerase [Chitinophagaceae bacterium]